MDHSTSPAFSTIVYYYKLQISERERFLSLHPTHAGAEPAVLALAVAPGALPAPHVTAWQLLLLPLAALVLSERGVPCAGSDPSSVQPWCCLLHLGTKPPPAAAGDVGPGKRCGRERSPGGVGAIQASARVIPSSLLCWNREGSGGFA